MVWCALGEPSFEGLDSGVVCGLVQRENTDLVSEKCRNTLALLEKLNSSYLCTTIPIRVLIIPCLVSSGTH